MHNLDAVNKVLMMLSPEKHSWDEACENLYRLLDLTPDSPKGKSGTSYFPLQESKEMSAEGILDKVNVNVGGGEGGGGAGLAAVIAALGNRNQGGDNAALIAALGNRNDDSSNWAPLMAMMGGGGLGGGNNALWPILLLALLGRGRGGLLGGGDGEGCCGPTPAQAAMLQTLLEGQSDLRAAVPTVGLETQNAIQNSIAQFALGTQQGFSNVKDSIQATSALNLSATNQGVKEILGAICTLSGKIDNNTILDLQRQLGVAQATAAEERHHGHIKEVEVNVSQNVNQQQAQVQFQNSLNNLAHQVSCLVSGHNQLAANVSRVTQFGTGNVALPTNTTTNQQG